MLVEDGGCHPFEMNADELRAPRRGMMERLPTAYECLLSIAGLDCGFESFRLKFSVSLEKNLNLTFGLFQFFSAGT